MSDETQQTMEERVDIAKGNLATFDEWERSGRTAKIQFSPINEISWSDTNNPIWGLGLRYRISPLKPYAPFVIDGYYWTGEIREPEGDHYASNPECRLNYVTEGPTTSYGKYGHNRMIMVKPDSLELNGVTYESANEVRAPEVGEVFLGLGMRMPLECIAFNPMVRHILKPAPVKIKWPAEIKPGTWAARDPDGEEVTLSIRDDDDAEKIDAMQESIARQIEAGGQRGIE